MSVVNVLQHIKHVELESVVDDAWLRARGSLRDWNDRENQIAGELEQLQAAVLHRPDELPVCLLVSSITQNSVSFVLF